MVLRLLPGHKTSQDYVPWHQGASIYEYLRQRIGKDGCLNLMDRRLPDEEVRDDQIKFAPGALDGIFGASVADEDEAQAIVDRCAELISELCESFSSPALQELYDYIREHTALTIVDALIARLANLEFDEEPFYRICRWIVEQCPDREPVKFGLAMLGCFGELTDRSLFFLFGAHEEFTLFASVALANCSLDPKQDLWKMAKSVHGWGRIHCVERLVSFLDGDDRQIRRWLLKEGYKNEVMYSYSALTCALYGQLDEVLSRPVIDVEVLEAAGEILASLYDEDAIEGIIEYAGAVEATQSYISHMCNYMHTVHHLCAMLIVEAGLWRLASETDVAIRKKLQEVGLTQQFCQAQAERIRNRIDPSTWVEIVRNVLRDDERHVAANRCADLLGIDVWDIFWEKIAQRPINAYIWEKVMARTDQNCQRRAVNKALKVLPFRSIATGPQMTLGLGIEFELHNSVDAILTKGNHLPEVYPFALAALESPSLRNRNTAISFLESHLKSCPEQLSVEKINELIAIEPDLELQTRLRELGRQLSYCS